LVIAPLNQLMAQQTERLEQWGIPTVCLTAGVLQNPQVYPRMVAGHYKIIYASPECTLARDGALYGLLSRNNAFLKKLLYVVVDEVHLVLDWGGSFRPAYANIPALHPFLDRYQIPIIAMTATINVDKLHALCRILHFEADRTILVRESTNRPNIFYGVKQISSGQATSYVCFSTPRFTFLSTNSHT
jgi:ATP-dependent DNA helicase RecQ